MDEKYRKIATIGRTKGLKNDRLILFIELMSRYFAQYEPDYWEEWAERFAVGTEVRSLDVVGRRVLTDIIRTYDDVSATMGN